MTVTSLCRSTLDSESILSFCTTLFVIPVTYLSFRAIAGIQEAFLSFNIREKNNIDSPLLISGITENENNKEKERKHWIPNQVGDDRSIVIPAKAGIQD